MSASYLLANEAELCGKDSHSDGGVIQREFSQALTSKTPGLVLSCSMARRYTESGLMVYSLRRYR